MRVCKSRQLAALLAVASSLFLLGCPHQSPPARAQEAATELNINTRFGRMELAAERVAPAAREAFLARRRAWGGNVRVADYEMASFRMKGEADAEMVVKVAWYRIDEGDLRVTMLKQKWHDFRGDWRLVDEHRAEGDVGLIGEPAPADTARTTSKKGGQFPTIRLGQGGPNGETAAPEVAPSPRENAEADADKAAATPSAGK